MSAETFQPIDQSNDQESELKEVVGDLEYDYSDSPLGPDQKKFNEYNRRIAGNGEPLTDEERAQFQQLQKRYDENRKQNLKRTQSVYDQNSRGNLN